MHSFPRIWIGATYVSRRIKIPRFNVTHHRAEGVRRDEVYISCVTNRSTKSIFLIGISSTASLAVTLRYLIPPQLDIYIVHLRVIIIAVRFPIRIEQMYSFERVFFFRTQDNKGDNVQNGKEERDGHITRKHGDSRGMKSAGTSRCSRFPVPSSTCQLLPNIRYSILRYTILLLIIMNIMYAIA